MPKELAIAIISFVSLVIVAIIAVPIATFFNSKVNVEYTLQTSNQILPTVVEFLPSTPLIEFLQRNSDKTNVYSYKDQELVSNLIRNKNLIDSIKKIGDFDCATFINISNTSDLKATNVTIVGKNSQGLIAEGPFQFLRSAPFTSFSEISNKKNIGELLAKESKNYLVLSKYDCGLIPFTSPMYSVVYDQGVAYFEEFPETHGAVNLALRHQVLAYILITIGIITIVNFIYYLTTKLIIAISTALRTTTSPAEGREINRLALRNFDTHSARLG